MVPPRPPVFLAAVVVSLLHAAAANAKENGRESLWAAVRNGDAKAVKTLLSKGTDVNAKNEIGITALWIAASNSQAEIVGQLLKAGADVNARDGIWYQTPLSLAVGGGHAAVVKDLLRAGARDVDAAVISAAAGGKLPVLRAVLHNNKPRREALDAALFGTLGRFYASIAPAARSSGRGLHMRACRRSNAT